MLARSIARRYRHALIVPVRDERADFVNGLLPALRATRDTLLIVVVNADQNCDASVLHENDRVLSELAVLGRATALAENGLRLFEWGDGGLLLVDRTSPGHQLPLKQGVGMARKIGCDIALALWSSGGLQSPWLCTTDADAQLPHDYFASADGADQGAGAVLWDFVHRPSDDAGLDAATSLYELYLRYYTLGLRWARSPYAFLSLGSCLAVRAEAYAQVRGFPKREAGEDFHLLCKVAKVAPIQNVISSPIRIESRRSRRTPFGTGARVETLLEGQSLGFQHPDLFVVLRAVLEAMGQWVTNPAGLRLAQAEVTLPARLWNQTLAVLDDLGVQEALRHAAAVSADASGRLSHLHTWFDALKTLRFVHDLEQRAHLNRMAWRMALTTAPFLRFKPAASLSEALDGLRRLGREQPQVSGRAAF